MDTTINAQWIRHNAIMQPPARKGGCLAYDVGRNRTLLFGGGGLNDTWSWDGSSWTQLHPSQSPPPRTSACMAYDSQHGTILLFGGVSTSGLLLGDTWLWNGTTWTQLQPQRAPTARCGAVMAYSEAQRCLVLFGGEASGGRVGRLLNDTWAWNGALWSLQAVPAPPPERVGSTLTYDVANRQLVLFGGTSGSALYGDTWTWTGQKWQSLSPSTSPLPRAWATMTYVASLQQVILVGGSSVTANPALNGLNDIWQWNGTAWGQLNSVSAPAGGYHSAAYDSTRQTLMIYASTNAKLYPVDKHSRVPQGNTPTPVVMQSETWLWHTT
ncbi:MAG TPA: kelch repeat-containing protein [Ktedonobacteraceae bacterium]|nr:kelch repeat-containing protein [Ktedonobacteraceae bacterium]